MSDLPLQPQPVVPTVFHEPKPRTASKLGASMTSVLIPSPSAATSAFSPTALYAKLTTSSLAELIVRVDPDAKIGDDISHLGGKVVRDQGPVRTVVLPVKTVREACGINAIRTMRPSRRFTPKLNEVAAMHDFSGYRRNFGDDRRRGEGVIIGIVDTGVSGSHAAFGNRLIECWDQTVKGRGAGPFDYGALLKPAQSVDRKGHGTHVAGIAAGNDSEFCGVAPRARLIAIRTDFTQGHVQEAITYVFERARQLNCPAVVNLSLGGHNDPHDGTDDIDLHIDFESGPGRIVVAAAGNEGADAIHTKIDLQKGDETAVGFRIPPLADRIALNIWYSGGEAEVAVSSPDGASTPFQGPLDTEVTYRVYDMGNTGRAVVNTPPRNAVNDDHEVRVTIESAHAVEAGRWFLHVRAGTAPIELHAWSVDESGTGAEVSFTAPVDTHLIGSPAAARSAITASAYVSRNQWTSADGQAWSSHYPVGKVAPFSSPGPLRKSSVPKPDYAVAGEKIVSCRSSNGQYQPSQLVDEQHAVMGGTSMACAVLSGVVATMLEEHPAWTSEDVKAALKPFSRGTYSPTDGYGLIRLVS